MERLLRLIPCPATFAMNVTFYLDNKEVHKAIFKKFSFQCDTWVRLLADHDSQRLAPNDVLELTYRPVSNTVSAVYNPENIVAQALDEQVAEIAAVVWDLAAPAGKLVALN